MNIDKDIADLARLLGDKTRATMLLALMEGCALTAGELARRADVSPQTASNHLKKLLQKKLIVQLKMQSRHRYYQLASPEVADVIETLSILSNTPKQPIENHHKLDKEICFARTCYDHLAGYLGVNLTKALLEKNFLEEVHQKFQVTQQGINFFKTLDIDCNKLLELRRHFAKPCLDWTERKFHLAGSLGAALLNYLIDNKLLLKSKKKPRVILLTEKGRKWLREKFHFTAY